MIYQINGDGVYLFLVTRSVHNWESIEYIKPDDRSNGGTQAKNA